MQLVVGALIVDDLRRPTRVLAARRTRPAELAGRWEFPGGKVEDGESPEGALRREVLGELGVVINVGAELLGPAGGAWPISSAYELRLFYAVVADGVPTPGDSHDDVRSVGLGDIGELDWLDSDRAALSHVFG